ncbi:MAG TPA: AI-2E family transporter [Longimicrobium sp.]|jgi:predicted PurR-regulated permease PerM|uniref:AI-2E family transporter n=1 Tax=Longimicrobium sp. TaxID=2029185 RepID=UPI002ED8221D
MNDRAVEPFNWRTWHAVLVIGVLALFLFSIKSILNPFILFLLLLFLVQPYSGTRYHVMLVSTAALLTFVWVLDTTGFLLAPFVLALVLAYIQHPLIARMEKRGVSRLAATLILALPAIGVICLILFVGIPALSAQIADFIRGTPQLLQTATTRLEQWQAQLQTRDLPWLDEQAVLERMRSVQPEAVMAWMQQRQEAIARGVWSGLLGVGAGVGAVLSLLSYVFLTPIITFYLLRDWRSILLKFRELVPGPYRDRVVGFASEYDRLLARYLRGQVLAAAIVGVLTWIGFWIAGFPYALLLGAIAGVFNIIPYMGLVASLIPALVIALFSANPLVALLKIAAVFAVVQVLDSSVIGPRVVGEAVGLHPVWVLLALAVSGYFFGFVGLLIAVPLAVLVKLLLGYALTRYRGSSLFRGEQPLVVD